MGDWLKIYYYGRIKQSKAKQLFASRNFHYSLLLFTIGIYAIIRSMKVNDYYMMKQYDAAAAAAADAKKWSIIGIVAGVIFQVIYFGFLGGMSYLSAFSH